MTCQWMAIVAALAQWARSLVVRKNAYGKYIPPGRRTDPKKIAFTVKAELTEEVLKAHFSGGSIVGLFVLDDLGFCRLFVVDIDRHDEAGSPETNEKAAIAFFDRAVSMGFSAFLEDSNGRGGYKLWLIFKEPVPASWVRRFANWLIRDWEDLGLEREPEIFPKQDELGPGKLGNFIRLPGKHHTLDHKSRIWGDGQWLKGEPAAQRILATVGSSAEAIPEEFRTEAASPSSPPAPKKPQGVRPSAGFIRMLRSALTAIPLSHFGDYQRWLRLGMCLRNLDDTGLELWDEASQRCSKYRPGECRKKWDTFDPLGKLTYRTVLRLAKDNGWKPPARKKGGKQTTTGGLAIGQDVSGPQAAVTSGQGNAGIAEAPSPDSVDSTSAIPPQNASPISNGPPPQKPDDEPTPPEGSKPRPVIYWGDRPSDHVTNKALVIYKASNLPKIVFAKGGKLVRIIKPESGPLTEKLDRDAMRGILARIADWEVWMYRDKKGNDIYNPTPPQEFVVKDILSLPNWDPDVFPVLTGIVRAPVIAPDGSLVDQPGYHRASGLYYEPEDGVNVPPVSLHPTDDEIIAAKAIFFDDHFIGFPFVSNADRINALAMLLTPFVRSLIQGPTPLMLIDAPVQGTGKGLLAECVVFPAVGELPATPPPEREEEWSKTITSLLDASVPVVLFDNLTGVLRSASLAAALTTRKWSARRLGTPEMVNTRIDITWLATANNVSLDDDMSRRVVYSRIDAKMEFPYERPRESFKHHDLRKWVKDNRGRLIWAALTLARAWISRGRPPGNQVMGSYESWVETIGGILQVCGIGDFLGNREKRRSASDTDSAPFRAFCQSWFEKHGEKVVGAKDLYQLVEEKELLVDLLIANSEQGSRNKLGRLIKKMVDRHFGPYKILDKGVDNSGRRLYQLELTKAGANSGSGPTEPQNSAGSPTTGAPTTIALASAKSYDQTLDVDLVSWALPDDELASILFRRNLEFRLVHRVYLDDASAQLYDLCHAIFQCRSHWRVITDRTLVRFARTRGLLAGILTAQEEDVQAAQFEQCFQEMNYYLDGLAEISLYDRFQHDGRWISRYSIRDLGVPDFAPVQEPAPWQSDDPLAREPFDVTEYLGAGFYPHFADLCRCLWEAGNPPLATSQILEVVYTFDLLPGFGTTHGEGNFSHFVTDLRHLDFLLSSVQGFEFEGFLIEPTTVSDQTGTPQPAFCLSPVDGYGAPAEPVPLDPEGFLRRHRKPYIFTGRDFVRLLGV